MLKKDLAIALGISAPMVTKLHQRGMPIDSVEAAQQWRRQHLDPGRVKPGTSTPRRRQADPVLPAPVDAEQALQSAQWLMDTASERLRAGGDIGPLVQSMRLSLAAVPVEIRPRLLWCAEVAEVLTRHAHAVLDVPARGERTKAEMTEDEAFDMGAFWYQIAAGELLRE